MNSYAWSDLHEGLRHAFTVEVTSKMLDAFREISGDTNPLHGEASFAQAAGYPDRVVFGLLTASFYSRLVGVYLPGKFALLHGLDLEFTAPVFPGDALTVSGEVTHLVEAYRRIEIKAEIRNGKGDRVSRAKIRVGMHEHR